MTTWDPQQYQRFQKERAQPFFDLLSRIPDGEVTTAADLGCGPGTLTATLTERWPHASVWGVDNSPQMLATARAQPAQTHLHFVESDIAEWQPPRRLDRIISNAALHWVPEHQTILQRLVSLLTPYGVLAVQMPNNHAEAAHRILRESVQQEPWGSLLAGSEERFFMQTPDWYAHTLHTLGCTVQVWETIYYQLLPGKNAVLEWMKGTALRPTLERLGQRLGRDGQTAFLDIYGQQLAQAYPAGPNGTLFPFRRLFFIAQRAEP